jgi:pimeloyl-ACP methyl ester carboxylesterase
MAVVERYGASRALGVSLGVGALLRAAWADPAAFDRLVFVLPSTIDRPRQDPATSRMQAMADLVERGDVAGLADAMVADQPAGARGRAAVARWAAKQAERLVGEPSLNAGVARALRELPTQQPLDAGADLSAVTCPVLVVGQDGDEAHPAVVARELAARLPNARLRVFDGGGLVWAHREELRDLVSGFLNQQ